MNHALMCTKDKSPVVQQHAAKVVGTASSCSAAQVMAAAAASSFYEILEKRGERHRRRRAKPEEKPTALAIEACIKALGQVCEHQQQQLGEHAPKAWAMWLSSLPLKYDEKAGQEVHAQLLRLLVAEHPVLLDPMQLPKVLQVLLDVHKTKFSTSDLNKKIEEAVNKIGQDKLQIICNGFKESHKDKIEHMLKSNKAVGGAWGQVKSDGDFL